MEPQRKQPAQLDELNGLQTGDGIGAVDQTTTMCAHYCRSVGHATEVHTMGKKKDAGSRLPYFTFYPGDWLSSATVSSMTAEEEGTFIRLLALAWVNDGLPAEPERLRAIVKIPLRRFQTWLVMLDELFPIAADGRRRNPRQESERNSATHKTMRRAAAGAKGAAKRWQADGNAIQMPMANDGYTQIQIQNTEGKQQQAAVPPVHAGELPTSAAVAAQPADALQRTARLLTAAANRGIAEKYGEQPVPINAASAGAYRCTEALHEAGVDSDFAAAAIFECAKTLLLAKPPRSLGYFLQHVLDRWTAAQAHREAAQFDPKALPTTSAKPAEGDQLRYAAMRYAQEGSAEWQAYCEERGIDWRVKTA